MAQYGAVSSASKNLWDFDPRAIGPCFLWLDSADANTITLSGSNVTQWKDKSINGYHATGTAGNYPTWSNATSGITFNPTNSGATVNTTQYLGRTGMSYGSNLASHTTFLVHKQTSVTNVNRVFCFSGATADYQSSGLIYGNLFSPYTAWYVYGLSSGFYPGSSWTGPGTPWAKGIYADGYDFPSKLFYAFFNGASATTGTVNASNQFANNNDRYYVGVGYLSGLTGYYNGIVYEVIVFNSYLPAYQRQQVEGYLAWKWGLQASLPATHPFRSGTGTIVRPFARQFQPIDILGCVLWIDAADSTSITTSGGSVTGIVDKSGLGANSTSVSGTITYLSNGINSLNVLSFPASITYIIGNSVYASNILYGFIVATISSSSSSGSRIFDFGTNGSAAGEVLMFSRNASNQQIFSSMAGVSTAGANITYNTPFVGSVAYTGATLTTYVNGVGGTGVAATSNLSYSNYILGSDPTGSTQFTGYIGEVIAYTTSLTISQRQQVEAYLAWKWGIRSSFSSTYPFYKVPSNSVSFIPRIISGLVLWLDAADSSTITISSGTSVSQWSDKSGNADNAAQANASLQPTYANSTVTFNGSSQYMTLSSPSTLPNGATPTGTYFFVTKLTTGSAVQAFFMYGRTTLATGANPQFYYNSSNQLVLDTFGAGGTTDGTAVLNSTVIFSSTIANSGGTGTVTGYRNSNSFGPTTYTTASITSQKGFVGVTQTGVGTSGTLAYYFTGNIYEILIYNSVLSTSQRQQVEGYLAWKWGLNANLPTTHAFYKIRP